MIDAAYRPTQHATEVTRLSLSRIVRGDNPRRYFDQTKHQNLVDSLRLRGMLQPILLRPKPGTDGTVFAIVAGERRYRAALDVYGPDGEVPVRIREMSDQEALDAAIAENDDRDDPSETEQAETEQADAAVRYLASCQGDRAEAARRLGWSASKLDRRLALAELCDPAKTALDERRIKVGHAELLAAVPPDKQEKALETILRAGLDVAKTRELLMKVTQSLANVAFDKTECTTCPFNSGLQRVLFETHVDDGHCTNAACFQLKVDAVEQAIREKQERDAATAAAATSLEPHNSDDPDSAHDDPEHEEPVERVGEGGAPSLDLPSSSPKPANRASATNKLGTTAQSIANRTTELREASWRTALARVLAGNPEHARTAILAAAMSGTLSQIKASTLTARAGLLVGTDFPNLDFKDQLATIRALPGTQAATVLSAIGAAYAKDVQVFDHVADGFHGRRRNVPAAGRRAAQRLVRFTATWRPAACGRARPGPLRPGNPLRPA